jgi:hypothetical protein
VELVELSVPKVLEPLALSRLLLLLLGMRWVLLLSWLVQLK